MPDRPSRSLDPAELLAHRAWMRRFAAALVGAEGEDLAQDTWVRVLSARAPALTRPRAWLASVMRNGARMAQRGAIRREQREAEVARAEAALSTNAASTDELAAQAELEQLAMRAVLALSEPYRHALLLCFVGGLEPSEIAKELGFPPATVRSHIARGLAEVRSVLDRRHGRREAWVALLAPGVLAQSGTAAAVVGGGTGMSAKWIAAAAALAAALLWGGRLGRTHAPEADGALPRSAETELATTPAPELLPVSGLAPGDAGAADDSRSPALATAGTSDAPLRARIRGRVVMADTLEPLEAVLSVRLRTTDLRLVDPVETEPDGSFVSWRSFPEGGVLARVCTAEERELVDHEGRFDPSSTEPWLVRVPGSEFPTSARGRVVDLAGDPVSGAMVHCAPPAPIPEEPWLGEADAQGAFEIHGLTPGAWELRAVARHVRGPAQEFALSRGENDLGTLVLPSPGALCGRLVADVEPRAHFLVRELGTGRVLSVQEDESEDMLDDGLHPFRISGLPAGEYELSPLPLDGRNYEPASRRASPPASGLEFRAVSPPSSVELTVQDSESGEALLYEAFSMVRGRWLDGFHPQAERWLIAAEEHRPASLDSAALPATGESPARVSVLLERGWGKLRLYQIGEVDPPLDTLDKWSRAPLPGVQVRADGFPVATSDEDGVALVSLARAPRSLDEWLLGWSKSKSSSYKWRGMVVVTMTRE